MGTVKTEWVCVSCVRPIPDCSCFWPSGFRCTGYTGCLLPRAAWACCWSGNWQRRPVKPGGHKQCFRELHTPPFIHVRGHTTADRNKKVLVTQKWTSSSLWINSDWEEKCLNVMCLMRFKLLIWDQRETDFYMTMWTSRWFSIKNRQADRTACGIMRTT